MVGQLGTAELAAVSLGNSFFLIAMSIGIGFSTAITPLIAETDGMKNVTLGKKYFYSWFDTLRFPRNNIKLRCNFLQPTVI